MWLYKLPRRWSVNRGSGSTAAGSSSAGQVARVAQLYWKTALAGVLVSLAIVLHLFKVPFPPAPFLKFDGVGIPLATLSLYSISLSVAIVPVVFVALQVLGADVVGAGMKVLAELSTYLPLALMYRRVGSRGLVGYVVSVGSAIATRVVIMTLANYIITPYWILMAGWARTYEQAYSMTLRYLPWVAAFNAIVALYVAPLALAVFRVLRRVV
jgi:riboflavin transporter FmnP